MVNIIMEGLRQSKDDFIPKKVKPKKFGRGQYKKMKLKLGRGL